MGFVGIVVEKWVNRSRAMTFSGSEPKQAVARGLFLLGFFGLLFNAKLIFPYNCAKGRVFILLAI